MPSKHQLLWISYTGVSGALYPSQLGSHGCLCQKSQLVNRNPRLQRLRYQSSSSDTTNGQPHDEDPHWPQSLSQSQVPTPYEIFGQRKGSPYSKRRFYELVKIYHPDKNINSNGDLGCTSRATRLERYRLVIAANDILSNPIKRDAYDRWGAGWQGKPEHQPWSYNPPRDESTWSGFHDNTSAANNATWEDWERWRHNINNPKQPQTPIYVSNGTFVVLIVLFAVAGGFAELGRAKNMSRSYLQQLEEKHDRTSKELMRSRTESHNMSSSSERVKQFMKLRGTGNESLPVPELCLSGGTQKKGSSRV